MILYAKEHRGILNVVLCGKYRIVKRRFLCDEVRPRWCKRSLGQTVAAHGEAAAAAAGRAQREGSSARE